ncbi:hypothetical protein [Pseudoduganella sp. OTU4001]|uniref:hypothetical protein n=1 Tax=Pseudoduganella sp. OTU4001 TaxID=3043854 RepID=UPI00313E627A
MQLESKLPFLLRATGLATGGAAIVFLLPQPVLNLLGLTVTEAGGLFFVRHWGLLVGCIAGLMVYAARQPALQRPIMLVAALEKLALVLMVANLPSPGLMWGIAGFDGLCVLLFCAILLRRK